MYCSVTELIVGGVAPTLVLDTNLNETSNIPRIISLIFIYFFIME